MYVKEGCNLPESTTGTRSITELESLIEALSDEDYNRLAKIGSIRALGMPISGEDLLHEAVRRVLDGKRNCPVDVPLAVFLAGVMRSLASAARTEFKRQEYLDDSREAGSDSKSHHSDGSEWNTIAEEDVLSGIDYQSLLSKLFDIFEQDEQGFLVLLARAEGYSADEIREEQHLDKREYATILKRTRRRLARAIAEGTLHAKQ